MVVSIWHTQDERPQGDGPLSGLIALPGDGDITEPVLLGIVMWRDGLWLDEDTGKRIRAFPRFWWCLEEDLLSDLPGA